MTEPTVRRRKVPLWVWLVGDAVVTVIVVAVVLVLVNRDDKVSSPPAESPTLAATTTPNTATIAPSPAAGIGEWVKDANLEFAVNEISTESVVVNTFDKSKTATAARGVFVVVHVVVVNNTDKTQFLTDSLQTLTAGRNQYHVSPEANAVLGAESGVVDLPPGITFFAELAFDVPVSAIPESLELHSAPGSEPLFVKL